MRRERHEERSRDGKRSRSLGELLARKRELAERSDEQRQSLALAVAGLSPAFAAGDKAAAVGRSILSRPLLLAAAGGLLFFIWPRAPFALAARGFALWNGARAVRRLLNPAG